MKIRDVIKIIERDGWFLVATKGSHRQYKHSFKPGRVRRLLESQVMILLRELSIAF